jgi:integrase
VLTAEEKRLLFDTAASNDAWGVVFCAAVLAASTTCRGVELKHLRWRDVNLIDRVLTVGRSKTEAGERSIPLNGDAIAALARLWEQAQLNNAAEPENFVFPACEHGITDPTKPQKSWRTSWRKLVKETGKRAGRRAASDALLAGRGLSGAKAAWKRAAKPFKGFRFHDLRHQAITELAESGTADATIEAVAGHLSRRMLEHYSHARMAAKRDAISRLESSLITTTSFGAAQQSDTKPN